MRFRVWDRELEKHFEEIYRGEEGEFEDISVSRNGDVTHSFLQNGEEFNLLDTENRFEVELCTELNDFKGNVIYVNDRLKDKDGNKDIAIFEEGNTYFIREILGTTHYMPEKRNDIDRIELTISSN